MARETGTRTARRVALMIMSRDARWRGVNSRSATYPVSRRRTSASPDTVSITFTLYIATLTGP